MLAPVVTIHQWDLVWRRLCKPANKPATRRTYGRTDGESRPSSEPAVRQQCTRGGGSSGASGGSVCLRAVVVRSFLALLAWAFVFEAFAPWLADWPVGRSVGRTVHQLVGGISRSRPAPTLTQNRNASLIRLNPKWIPDMTIDGRSLYASTSDEEFPTSDTGSGPTEPRGDDKTEDDYHCILLPGIFTNRSTIYPPATAFTAILRLLHSRKMKLLS